MDGELPSTSWDFIDDPPSLLCSSIGNSTDDPNEAGLRAVFCEANILKILGKAGATYVVPSNWVSQP